MHCIGGQGHMGRGVFLLNKLNIIFILAPPTPNLDIFMFGHCSIFYNHE